MGICSIVRVYTILLTLLLPITLLSQTLTIADINEASHKLKLKEQELIAKEDDLRKKEEMLNLMEKDIKDKEAALVSIRTEIDDKLQQLSKVSDSEIAALAKMYNSVKPRDAASVIVNMDVSRAASLMKKMSSMNAAKIMGEISKMNPTYASALTIQMYGDNTISSMSVK